MDIENDLIYIDKILQGDIAVFSKLVDKYKGMVYSIALKLLKNSEDAEDIAQESFIKAYKQLGNFNNESKFSTWLFTITYRSAMYHLRRNTIETRYINHRDNEKLPSNHKDQVDRLKVKEQQYYIKEIIDSLPTIEGLLVTLYYINENSIEEISAITDLSKTNIKVKLFRARKKLKNSLECMLKEESRSLL